ncbi:Cytochrome C oxidase, cbb3-type, subunit III [Catalinimonas alkaloidigena]|uniref:Cytochrome C oxidase, cbb3-type, subunit III n=1 Tax=Catalinimonas alkaloidigena TaxID=1075417 RepID=A0A1G9ALH4_9BACT|nr:cytochrome c [Catalinimonas alkaloidigena]SDK28091.1 Cytochrome C oxidase, cbb3-type, subunit III [Catalinimonas alkaloidigena]
MKKSFFFAIALGLLTACGGNTENTGTADSTLAEDMPATSEPVPEDQTPANGADAQLLAAGEEAYKQYCIACHQADGKGVPPAFPPLAESDWVAGDTDRLINVLLNGLDGEIVVNGETYSAMMPTHNFLSDEQIAGVLTYVRTNFGNDASPVAVEDVTALRNKN